VRIAVGFDHRGYLIKRDLIALLEEHGHEVVDLGTTSTDPVDYPDVACAVGGSVLAGEVERGIVVCGSGAGAVMAANKLPGIRCASATETYTAHQMVEHDDANVLALGSGIVGLEVMKEIVVAFVDAKFDGGQRYRQRLDKMAELERRGGSGEQPAVERPH
jgi:RpiB/LacA/LacB family sugar-phosphate isomerase